MASSTINVVLPEPLQAYVEARVESGSYGTPNEYIRELILDDRDRRLARLEEQLIEASSGERIEVMADEWESPELIEILRRKLERAA